MVQSDMFLEEDIYDVLKTVVKALGGSKKVGPRLWPAKNGKASSWLDDCINRERDAKLEPTEFLTLLRWGQRAGFHLGMEYVCQTSGYAPPVPVTPEDEAAELQKAYIESVRQQKSLTDRLEALQPGLRAVR